MSRVLLVNMPFSSLRWPAIGVSLLKAGLEQRGIGCDVAYFNFDFAEAAGLELYDWLNDSFGFVLGGERIFAKHFFPGELEYELKTNLTRAQVQALVDAGLRAAQLGIETLSSPVLKLMRKGVSAVQNVQTLKWLTEAGVEVKWNLLYGFPGENPDDYRDLPDLFLALLHLTPPQAAGQVRIDRFSPYFECPQSFGLTGLAPAPAYRHNFPFPAEQLARIAYYFETDQTKQSAAPDYVQPVLEAMRQWQQCFPAATLRQSHHPDNTLVLLDTRPNAARFQFRLRGIEREVYSLCDTAQPWPKIVEFARSKADAAPVSESQLRRTLDRWLADRIMVQLDGRFLSLALCTSPQTSDPTGLVPVACGLLHYCPQDFK